MSNTQLQMVGHYTVLFPPPTKYPVNSAIIYKEKFVHPVNGDTQNIGTIITCWAWVTSGFDLFDQYQAARSLGVQALVLVAAPSGPPSCVLNYSHQN